MNKYIRFLFLIYHISFLISLTACQSRQEVQSASQQTDTLAVKPAKVPSPQQTPSYSTANKGKIEAGREIPVSSRIAEQIIMFGITELGQHVKKGQVVARLSEDDLRNKILHSRAKLEKAEFQYKAILMGQGYKRDNLDAAPDNIKQLARVSSGYNEAKAELNELEHQLSYCTIKAPISGYVTKIQNTLYGAASPGVPLFYIVDVENMKVGFDVLENELAKYENGATLTVSTVTFPKEKYKATISGVNPVIDGNGMVHIEATLEPHPHLAPGMTAFVTISN